MFDTNTSLMSWKNRIFFGAPPNKFMLNSYALSVLRTLIISKIFLSSIYIFVPDYFISRLAASFKSFGIFLPSQKFLKRFILFSTIVFLTSRDTRLEVRIEMTYE